ncbi:unnamed protein product [Closterium sp. Yama58-4]|nr:unnamed protein product [Closterium sp. Yama58-4]
MELATNQTVLTCSMIASPQYRCPIRNQSGTVHSRPHSMHPVAFPSQPRNALRLVDLVFSGGETVSLQDIPVYELIRYQQLLASLAQIHHCAYMSRLREAGNINLRRYQEQQRRQRYPSRRKAEMYLVRTDGISCTREKVTASTLAFSHPSTQQQMLMWRTRPRTVLLLKKLGTELMSEAMEVARFLQREEGMNVMVEPELHDTLARMPGFGFLQTFYAQDTSKLHEKVDFVVCLGGDGVILHASNIFSSSVPPIVSFNLGSLGFLTAHPYEQFKQDLRAVIHGQEQTAGVYITLRMRLKCELVKGGQPVPGKVFDVLNEVVVDRGSNPYLCKIECYERSKLITKVQADGVIVATPTGSTAYSTAAGGSMVHPNVPCMLFTPICPHSLSFRPIILPDSAILELRVPADARSNCWVSFDGKKRQQLSRGDSVRISMSAHPVPTVNKRDQTDDWFASLVRCLNWNERMEQKGFNSVF